MIFSSVPVFAFSSLKLLLLPLAVGAAIKSAPFQGRGVGGGDLLVAPGRVLLVDSSRTVDVSLLNIGTKTATYRISLIHQRMDADGQLAEIQTAGPGEHFADELVRFTPRQVVLEPNVSQLVRIQMSLPAGLEAGEYRSHILFRAIPEPATAELTAGTDASATGISMQLAPIYGISIPLIVRHGKTDVTVGMKDLQLSTTADGIQVLTGHLTRLGNQSSYGDVQLMYSPKTGAPRQIGSLSGVAIYSPNSDRNFVIRLAMPVGTKLDGGAIKVQYRRPAVDGGRVIAEGTVGVS